MKLLIHIVIVLMGIFLIPRQVLGATPSNYYIDSVSGSDTNLGTSTQNPWKTLTRIQSQTLIPGDIVNLKNGSNWNQTLTINNSGNPDQPITFTTYGSGPKPVIRNSSNADTWARTLLIYADWIIIDGLIISDTSESAIYIDKTSDHNIIRNCEIKNAGIGIAVYGQYNLVTNNNVHDLHMIVNTQGGDDDYGAVGIWLFNSNNEVSYNTIKNCQGPSYDYNNDGGAIEFYGSVNNSYVHHNWAQNNEGFLEIGGSDSTGRDSKDNLVTYNVLTDNKRALHFNLGTYQYAVNVSNFRFENNTIVESVPKWETAINFIQGELTGNQLILRNNIFSGFYRLARRLDNGEETLKSNFTHEYNLYYGIGKSFTLGSGEILVDPLFVNLANKDLKLQAQSPAIDKGTNLGYSIDFNNNQVPLGTAPDMGAYEYQTQTSTLTPTKTPTTTPSSCEPFRYFGQPQCQYFIQRLGKTNGSCQLNQDLSTVIPGTNFWKYQYCY